MQDTSTLQQDITPQDLGRAVTGRADGKGSRRVGLEGDGVSIRHVYLGSGSTEFARVDGLGGRVLATSHERRLASVFCYFNATPLPTHVSSQNLGPGSHITARQTTIERLVDRSKDGQSLASTRSESSQGVDGLGVVEGGRVEGESGLFGRGRGGASELSEDGGESGRQGDDLGVGQ